MTSPEDIEKVLSSSVNIDKSFSYHLLHNWLGTGLVTSTGQKWQNRRKILTPAFHFNILKSFSNVFIRQTEELVKKLDLECSKPFTNVSQLIYECTIKIIAETAMCTKFDNDNRDNEEYMKNVHRMGVISTKRLLRPWLYPQIFYCLTEMYRMERNAVKVLHEITTRMIRKRLNEFRLSSNIVKEEQPEETCSGKLRQPMLDLLIKLMVENGNIDEHGIREEVDTFMFGGHDTVATSLGFSLMLLACHQEIQDLQGLSYMEMFIKESLRLYPSVPQISRRLDEPITTASGFYLPKDTEVYIHIVDLHLNEELWPDPYRFDPDRFLPEATKHRHPFAYIPFSAGPRNCIGQKFAMLEMKAILAGVVRSFRLTAVDTPDTLIHVADFVSRTKNEIKVKFERL
ncbi:cytochrome P450 4c3-like isoform X2 [Agrilus planipennis]|uniref:Cytochrome P450 4c3-like isoform X2 n=1 Tax=Agrilus planipennis TaxID=224129 RepID=A0A7F5QUX3_AGRPL|nr:cytochrome P450 4c3-like isoform X2 [Agrilus planipennis]